MSIVDGVAVLLPHLARLQLDDAYLKGARVRIEARTNAGAVRCPDCGTASRRVHSRYVRTLVDTGIGGREVTLRELQSMGMTAGINALIVGNYLTTLGRSPEDDRQMLDDLRMPVAALTGVL